MRNKTVPFLIFADIAFFLFAVVVMGYQYVQFSEGKNNTKIDSFALTLPKLPFQESAGTIQQDVLPSENIRISIMKNGDYGINGDVFDTVRLEKVLSSSLYKQCELVVDRAASAESLVFVLGLLDKNKITRIKIDYNTSMGNIKPHINK